MATPFIVPKIPMSKDSRAYETFTASTPSLLAPKECDVNCSSWCAVCEQFIRCENKRKPQTAASLTNKFSNETLRIGDSTNVKYEYKKVTPEKPRSTGKFQPKNQDHITTQKNIHPHFIGSRNRPIDVIKGKGWPSGNTHGHNDKYIREVESLRNSLKELSASSRKLPMLPTEHSAKPAKAPNGIRGKMPPQHTVNHDGDKTTKSKLLNPDSKRIRHLSDSDGCAIVNVNAAPKRLRDHSPLILGKGDTKKPEDSLTIALATYKNGDMNLDGIASLDQSSSSSSSQDFDVNAFQALNSSHSAEESHDSGVYSDGNRKNDRMKTAGSSPSYIVGDTLEKITLEDNPREYVPLSYRLRFGSHKEKRVIPAHPYIRLSLFSHVPPYVRFHSQEVKVEKPLPKSVQKVLKWKLSTITPIVVRQTVVNSGFKLVRRSTDWGGIWGRHMKSVCFKTLRENQKINHIPGTFQVGRKDRLWKNLYRFMIKFGKKEFGFIPRTYVLPQDAKLLRSAFDRVGSKCKWIVKPPASARGSGIKVIHKWAQIPRKIPIIVQKYISNPFLINGNKFDLRLYVLVTSFNPLKIYIYNNGLVRFASVKYSEENSSLTNRYMHLTNYSINKLSNNYAQNENAEACEGHKWTIRSLWTYLEENVNTHDLWDNLIELVIKTMISGESGISQMTRAHLNSRYSAYELFGVDVLLDENLKPWLLEVNISPSLHSASPLDIAVKGPLVSDLLNMAGYHIPNMMTSDQAYQAGRKLGISSNLLFDSRMYVVGLSPKEKIKHATFSKLEDREFYLDAIIEDLTPDDVRHLVVYEDEMTQIGSFQKIFPTTETYKYFQYLEGSRYYNMLFDAWETKYNGRRMEGVKVLEEKCRLQVHLDISQVETRHNLICTPDTPSTSTFDDDSASSDSLNSDSEKIPNAATNKDGNT